MATRLDGLTDDPGPGAPRAITDEDVERVVTRTPGTEPTNATHGSTRGMAAAAGMSQSAVGRIGRAFGLKPHRHETFELSTDPYFVEKVRDVVGLSMARPEKAIVLSVDEESQVRALDRTQPTRPMTPGQAERGTHDYVRHGVTALFAALNVATGGVIGKCHRRHRHREFIQFLDHLDATVPREPGVSIHIVPDNYATHPTPAVRAMAPAAPGGPPARHPDQPFVAEPDRAVLRRNHGEADPAWLVRERSIVEKAITEYLAEHNADPKPFAWVADADAILDRFKRVCERTSDSGH